MRAEHAATAAASRPLRRRAPPGRTARWRRRPAARHRRGDCAPELFARIDRPACRRSSAQQQPATAPTDDVDRRRRRSVADRHVVDAQQVEAGEQAAEHRAGDVAAVEEAEPRDARGPVAPPSARSPAASRPSAASAAAGRWPQSNAAHENADGTRGRRSRGVQTARSAATPNSTRSADDADAQLEPARRPAADARRGDTNRGRSRLPRHMPPMNVPSSTPSETADEPITSCSSWNQTIS